MELRRFSAFVHAFGRRGIPLHWNERCQEKHPDYCHNDLTIAKRITTRKARSRLNQMVRDYQGDWDNFDFVGTRKHYRAYYS